MIAQYDVAVVGAGPVAASVIWPLMESGLSIVVIDAGRPAGERLTLSPVLHNDSLIDTNTSPRLRLLPTEAGSDAYLRENRITGRNFVAVGALAKGGLSNVWGASVANFSAEDFNGWPISRKDIEQSYRSVARRIGLSGSRSDDMAAILGQDMPLDPELSIGSAMTQLLANYKREAPEGMCLGLARNAVITRDRDGRKACKLDRGCARGCAIGAVYNAADEIRFLAQQPNVRLIDNLVVEALNPDGSGWHIDARDRQRNSNHRINARTVILSAGVLGSTRLVLQTQKKYDQPIRLLNNPAMTLAFLLPSRIGASVDQVGYGMAELAYEIEMEGERLFGLLYQADSFNRSDLIAGIPISRSGALKAIGLMRSSLVLSMFYFPGSFSDNSVSLDRMSELIVSGGTKSELLHLRKVATARLSRMFRKLGAWRLPIVSRALLPGAEVHYAGTLPMGPATSVLGEVHGLPGLYVADGSIFPTLPAKSHTFTAMANADRIAKAIADRLRNR